MYPALLLLLHRLCDDLKQHGLKVPLHIRHGMGLLLCVPPGSLSFPQTYRPGLTAFCAASIRGCPDDEKLILTRCCAAINVNNGLTLLIRICGHANMISRTAGGGASRVLHESRCSCAYIM